MIGAIWRYRGFVWSSVKRDFLARYRGSLLGSMWAVLNPLTLILIYTVVFARIMKARLPNMEDPFAYGLYLCVGILTWNFYSEVLSRSQSMFLEQGGMLKKTNFPRSTLPLIVTGTATLNFVTVFGLFFLFLLVTGRFPGWISFAIIPLLIIQQGFAVGLGLILGTLNVFFRDVGQAVAIVLRFWFWLTPIVYPISILSEGNQNHIMTWNPLAKFIVAYQNIVLLGSKPAWVTFIPHGVGAAATLVFGYYVFVKLSGEMADEL